MSFYGPYLIRTRNIDVAWRSCINTIIEKGVKQTTEDKKQKTRETFCATIHLSDWQSGNIIPRDYIGLSEDMILENYIPQYLSSEKGEHAYTYGWCMRDRFKFNQLEYIKDQLSRGRSVSFAQLWNPATDMMSTNPPCINVVLFHKLNSKIHSTVYIRSNDMARAHPDDVTGVFTVFLTEVSSKFGGRRAMGTITTISGSAHIYETSINEIKRSSFGSISASNPNPKINEETLAGPILLKSNKLSGVLSELKKKFPKYSKPQGKDDLYLYIIFKLEEIDLKSKELIDEAERIVNGEGELGKRLRHYRAKTDEGKSVTIDQIKLAKRKLEKSTQSRRIIITPNNPWEKMYDLNPLIIQFLLRQNRLYTSALFADYLIKEIPLATYLIRSIQKEILDGNKSRLEPTAFFFMPTKNDSKTIDFSELFG
ncbi:MAG: thymidylate synthase [Candidatus Jordarchaeum sp.]|uniref:thymidylate synthase n=1 Tax=Candidatus Jordarchaeum sp. TaxID=2823881 RepID=UPI004049C18C